MAGGAARVARERSLAEYLGAVRAATTAHARADLERVIRLAEERLARPETVVCVAGAFKQGKSSLINALIGVAACPVDDDLATAAVTVVRNGPEVRIRLARRKGKERVTETIAPALLPDFVTERGNPDNRLRVELVEIEIPNPLLNRGWVFVDTPGIGGFNAAQAAAALGFLPAADALLFVTDASAELSASELSFLGKARAACPTVIIALTKIDLQPAWREIAAADARHLSALGLPAPMPVSAALRAIALQRADVRLNAESGASDLLERLHADAYLAAHGQASGRAIAEAQGVVQELAQPLERERAVLRDPGAKASIETDLRAARERLQLLRGPAARWGQRLVDGFSDITSSVDYAFRSRMRTILREAEASLEAGDPAKGWDRIATQLQADVAAAVGQAFGQMLDGSTRLRGELATLIDEATVGEGTPQARDVDVQQLWSGKAVSASTVRSGLGLGFGALRGAQSGVYMLGLLGNLFHLAVVGPALLGGAALFAGKSIVDERKRQVAQRRQEARAAIRQYVDDVQFEVGTRMRDLTRDLQRDLRDDMAARVEELTRTNAEAAATLERTLRESGARRAQRADVIDTELAALRTLAQRLSGLQSGPSAPGLVAVRRPSPAAPVGAGPRP